MTGLRMVVYECGAFELCLPSLGILYQINLLRYLILGRTPRTSGTRGEEGRIWPHRGHRAGWSDGARGLEQYAMPAVCVRIGPAGLLTVCLRYPLSCLVYCPDSLAVLV